VRCWRVSSCYWLNSCLQSLDGLGTSVDDGLVARHRHWMSLDIFIWWMAVPTTA
jgi:hypothetical protein